LTASPRSFGIWTCTALVVGNMIGSGIYLLPAALAPFGWNAVLGWLVTIGGALAIAYVFARLARALPRAGGPYAYTEAAFGPAVGFVTAWSYWLSVVVGNAAIAAGSVSYLSALFPPIGTTAFLAPALSLAAVWIFTALNCLGSDLTGRAQNLATIVKIVPLAAIIVVAAITLGHCGTAIILPLRHQDIHFTSISEAATLTLWGLLGLESATIPAEKVHNPTRTIPRSTLLGTGFTGFLYLCVYSAILLMLPAAQLAASPAPFADFLQHFWGGHTGAILDIFATMSGLLALIGWVLLQGELAWVMAERGVFPAWFRKTTPSGTPVRAHIAATSILTVLLIANSSKSIVALFTFALLLSTTGCLFAYLLTAFAALRLQVRGDLGPSPALAATSLIAALYSIWTIWGAGGDAAFWGFAALVAGFPIYAGMRGSYRFMHGEAGGAAPGAKLEP